MEQFDRLKRALAKSLDDGDRAVQGEMSRLLHELDVQRRELDKQREELQSAEQALSDSLDRYYELYDMAPIGYLSVDRDGRICEANLAAARCLGSERERDRLIGRPLASFMRERHAETLRRHLCATFGTGKGGCDLLLEARGRRTPVHIDSVLVHGDDGSPECRMVIIDLSQLRAAQEELRKTELDFRESEQRYSVLFERSPFAVALTTLPELRIVAVNSAFEQLLDCPRARVLDACWSELNVCDQSKDVLAQELEERGSVREHECIRSGTSGEQQSLLINIDRVVLSGRPHALMTIQDVTQRKKLEEEKAELTAQLHQVQKLEAIGTLASGVAHDFNNLLMGVSGCANIARSVLPADSSARMYIDEIKKAADSGAAISKRLLTFSSRRTVEPAVFDLNSSIAATQRMFERLLGEDIRLTLQLDASDSRVYADPGHLDQVLMNLAVNARDAMPSGGQLAIATQNVSLSPDNRFSLAPGNYIIMTVSDTGIGMDEETRSRLFEPFYTTKKLGKGTGLGLSTVYGIVKQAGGHIEVSSLPGKGTRFVVLLPTTDQPTTTSEEAVDIEPLQTSDGTVLLVEDDPTVRLAVRFYLEQGGYRVLEANSGDEALRCCANYPRRVDLLLTDVVLPGQSGSEIAQAVRAERPDIAIILMSAHPREWLAKKQLVEPGVVTLQKPFTAEALLSRVRTVLAPSGAVA